MTGLGWDEKKHIVYYQDPPRRMWRNWKLMLLCFILDRHVWVNDVHMVGEQHCKRCNIKRI